MQHACKILLLVFLLALVPAGAAPANQALIADLSRDYIEITTSFSGTRLLLFGATEDAGDVVVVVRGPHRREVIRKKERILGIWVNGGSVTFDEVPGYYFQASTRPLSKIAARDVLAKHGIGTDRLGLKPAKGTPAAHAKDYRSALLRLNRVRGLYTIPSAPIKVIGGRLFRVEMVFPSSVPTGLYDAEINLFQNGKVVSKLQKTLSVRKTGVEATIFEFAHQHAALYGILSIVIALFAGWFAGIIFKKV